MMRRRVILLNILNHHGQVKHFNELLFNFDQTTICSSCHKSSLQLHATKMNQVQIQCLKCYLLYFTSKPFMLNLVKLIQQ